MASPNCFGRLNIGLIVTRGEGVPGIVMGDYIVTKTSKGKTASTADSMQGGYFIMKRGKRAEMRYVSNATVLICEKSGKRTLTIHGVDSGKGFSMHDFMFVCDGFKVDNGKMSYEGRPFPYDLFEQGPDVKWDDLKNLVRACVQQLDSPVDVAAKNTATTPTRAEEEEEGRDRVICMAAPKDHLLFPCRHLSLCETCANEKITSCPICRAPVESIEKIFT